MDAAARDAKILEANGVGIEFKHVPGLRHIVLGCRYETSKKCKS